MKSLFHRSKPYQQNSVAGSSTMSRNSALYQEHTGIPKADPPLVGNWDSANTTIGAGVAIFHLASGRVVLCYHSTHGYYFLPKGRRDASEDTGSGAEREGFEEVGALLDGKPNTMTRGVDMCTSQATAIVFSLFRYPLANLKPTIPLHPAQYLRPL